MDDSYLRKSRESTRERLVKIVDGLSEVSGSVSSSACVYATGSFGRLEAGPLSDLDLFIVIDIKEQETPSRPVKRMLDAVDEIKLKYALINIVETSGIAKFDGGGKYLESHSIDTYTKWLGSQEDDYRNTLTGRILLLLESKCMIGNLVYKKTIDQVCDKYFRDFVGHEDNFIPAFLINDILRMWRTFCVNYEFNRKEGDSRSKIKNLKLKFSRMITCYSAVIYLLSTFAREGRVTPDVVKSMVSFSPTERLEVVMGTSTGGGEVSLASADIEKALALYSSFLELTHKQTALKRYQSDEEGWRGRSYEFGRILSSSIDDLGRASKGADRLRRLIMI